MPKFIRQPKFSAIFSGYDGILYAVRQGRLYWFKYKDGPNPHWFATSGAIIADEFNGEGSIFRFVMSGGPKILLAVDQLGRLWFFHHEGEKGEDVYDGKVISIGWEPYRRVFAGADNNIFTVEANGNMRWYNFDLNGTNIVWNHVAEIISTKALTYMDFFADKDNRIFVVDRNGGGLNYFPFDAINPKLPLINPINLGSSGWHTFLEIVAGANGEIYAMTKEGTLFFYKLNTAGSFEVAQRQIDEDQFSEMIEIPGWPLNGR